MGTQAAAADAPAGLDVDCGHLVGAAEPVGQYESAGHEVGAAPAAPKKPAWTMQSAIDVEPEALCVLAGHATPSPPVCVCVSRVRRIEGERGGREQTLAQAPHPRHLIAPCVRGGVGGGEREGEREGGREGG